VIVVKLQAPLYETLTDHPTAPSARMDEARGNTLYMYTAPALVELFSWKQGFWETPESRIIPQKEMIRLSVNFAQVETP
jgi:hypothetical protein